MSNLNKYIVYNKQVLKKNTKIEIFATIATKVVTIVGIPS